MDQFDVVRAYYAALNDRDPDRTAALFDEACIVEHPFPGDVSGGRLRGRDEVRERARAFFEQNASALEGGSGFDVRTIGGLGTGWGWVHADWTAALDTPEARGIRCRGYTHFLVEDGLIRRLRSVVTGEAPAAATETPREERSYPARPIVGVGAVVMVSPDHAEMLAPYEAPADGGVVLVKRRFEPLAGQWSLPGGMLETGETLESGVAREIKEETGLAVRVGPVVEVFDRILMDTEQRVRHHYVIVDYVCYPSGGRLQAGSDVSDVAVAAPGNLGEYRVAPKVDDVVRMAFERTRAR